MEEIDETLRIHGCIHDLLSVVAVSALWGGGDSSRFVTTLMEWLVAMLPAEFVYIRLSDSIEGLPVRMAWLSQARGVMDSAHRIGLVLDQWWGNLPQSSIPIQNPIGDGTAMVSFFPLGFRDSFGDLAVGSIRTAFPSKVETLLIRIAANQLSVGLQDVRLRSVQRQLISVLERRVAEQARDLTALNETLRQNESRFQILEKLILQRIRKFHSYSVVEYWNQCLVDYTGLTAEQVKRGGLESLHPNDFERMKAVLRMVEIEGTPFETELRVRGRDGRYC
ncbi:MAG TPA: hypothetical protein VK210_04070 [Terriglobia bacterium]|nr:hypothetical protein [Terriglobia bacterium]